MALLTNWLNTDKFDVLRDKTNAIVTAVNEIAGGGLNQRLVKNSTSDFDYAFTNGELWQTSATSVNLSTLTVGGGVTLAIPFNTFNSASGLIIRVYSSAGSGNYFIAKITGTGVTYGTTNVDVQVLKIGGSGTFTDWQIVPYFPEVYYSEDYTVISNGTSNAVFFGVLGDANTGTTWGNITSKIQKNNSSIFLNASFSISQTSGSLSASKKIDLKFTTKYGIVIDDSYELKIPVNARIINNTTLAYIRSEILDATTLIDSGVSMVRIFAPVLSSNERAEVSFNLIAESSNKVII